MGRPTKYDERRAERACDLLRLGCSRKDSAAGAGVAFTTFLRWERGFASFATALARAEAECAVQMTLVITRAAEAGDRWAALEWLKRRNPDEWSDRLNLTNKSDTDLLSEAAPILQRAGTGGAGGSDPAGADPSD